IALLSFTLASASGSMLAGRVGDMVLDYQTASEAEYSDLNNEGNYYWYGDNNYFTNVTQEDLLSQYEVKVSPVLIAEIYVIGTLVVMISIIIPSFMIMRLNPKQILLEQN
ncbi:MAG: ABC transporter permease, partial [Solobacterium sp.]|nr:ABC transporter permease [Solobacterium sp.]